jgi:hypothetical protein
MLELIIMFISGCICGSVFSAIITAAVQFKRLPPPWDRP